VNAAFERDHQNAWLKQFRSDFAKGFPKERIDGAVSRTFEGFQLLDKGLADGRPYLSGQEFSLSDIAWMPNIHRMNLMDWPFELTPNLRNWFAHISHRSSYQTALLEWQNSNATKTFEKYTEQRRAMGTDVANFGPLSEQRVA
jgi:glutathione S-transferase